MSDNENIDQGRRSTLRNIMAFAGSVAAGGIIPAPTKAIAKALTTAAGPSTPAVYEAITSVASALSAINGNLRYMITTMMDDDGITPATQGWDPAFSAAYDFGERFGSPAQYQQEVEFMVEDLRNALHNLHALQPRPAQIQASFDHLRTLYPSDVLAEQEQSFFADWLTRGDDAIAAVQQELQAPYDILWKHHHTATDFQKGVDDADAERAARKKADTLPHFSDMASAKKAGGYPIPADYDRTSVTIGTHHTSSAERYEHLGTISTHRTIAKG